jgi:hypothetical protein
MGRKGGMIAPTEERISDTCSTPLGLTFRVQPLNADKWGPQPTTQSTNQTTDGDEGGADTTSDSVSDQTW